jgi:hypothetical protein
MLRQGGELVNFRLLLAKAGKGLTGCFMPTKAAVDSRRNVMEKLCEQLPNCSKAMELVETGIERDLRLRERVALRYHGRLCPFCGCAAGKFASARQRMREAEAARKENA